MEVLYRSHSFCRGRNPEAWDIKGLPPTESSFIWAPTQLFVGGSGAFASPMGLLTACWWHEAERGTSTDCSVMLEHGGQWCVCPGATPLSSQGRRKMQAAGFSCESSGHVNSWFFWFWNDTVWENLCFWISFIPWVFCWLFFQIVVFIFSLTS